MAISLKVQYYRSEIVGNLQSYDLRLVVESATDMPEEVFVIHRRPAPPNGVEEDVFQCIADPVDLETYPVGAPDPSNEMPYYRAKEITLRFRSMELLEETRDLIDEDFQRLVNSLKAAEDVELYDEVTYS